ncbi:MAG TPA: bifunctional phosphoserine phosphatase/homoserine phosphotransferase ThrH [Anaerolineae bacterium]|nr:bifunctional phosphoserine phosphatase/homoserine phosphotransferase ThrH [Caldilineae bacterium]HID33130.1 bifunctional phosphoserine phosphatase/homoserine phosphotransferase ThrH [Anaerolineae bacterium]
MHPHPTVVTLDLEGVFTPEIWIAFADKVGIPELRRTTRDEPDYDKLMRFRIALLKDHGLTLADIQAVIAAMSPLPGAREFLDWLRARAQVIILSDTFYQFAQPLMAKLNYPTLFCHSLVIDASGMITDYRLRMPDSKRAAVNALKAINFTIVAAGDSYNDVTMLKEADQGFLFRPPENVKAEFPQFPVAEDYETLKGYIEPWLF